MRNFGPHSRRIASASLPEATTPSSPADSASFASSTARLAGVPEMPTRRSSGESMLVRIVTPSSAGRLRRPLTASRAARIISNPPSACTLIRRTLGSTAAAATAPATVFGISWNFRSRKISKPRPASVVTARGPSAEKSCKPTLKRPAEPRKRRARAVAGPRRSKSKATISRGVPRRGVWAPRAVPGGPWRFRDGQFQASWQQRKRRRARGLPRRGHDR
jgi:hypothetical protein